MSKRMLQRVLSMLSSAVIIAPTITSAAAQASAYEAYPPNQSSSAGKIAAGFHAPVNDNEFTGTGKGVKIALLDAGVTEYDTYKQVSFIDDDTIGSNHGDLMMSILSDKVPDASVMDVRVLDDEGKGTYSDVCKGIRWAVDNDADIIVMSFAGQSNSSLLGEAVEYAEKHNVFVVAAAGNSSSEQMFFPAAFETVISVGAIDADGNIYDFSNYGQYVDTYGINNSGTSGAAQVVAASAAVAIEFENGIKPSELRKDFQLNPKTFVPRSTEINADAVVYATACSKHNWEDWRITKQATCTSTGEKMRACKNYGCGTVERMSYGPVAHSYSWVKTTSATCTNTGKESYKCSSCGRVSNTRSYGPLGHDWENWRTSVSPTCSSDGKDTRACRRYGCGTVETRTNTNRPAHKYSWVTTVTATCNNTGKQSYKCSSCGYVSDTRSYGPLGHDWEDWRTSVSPTCSSDGKDTRACKRYGCGTVETRTNTSRPTHSYSWVTTVTATCTNTGKQSYKCSKCGYVSETKNYGPLGHDWEDWRTSIAPTCGADGKDTRACKRYGCGTVETRTNTNRPAHKYSWVTTVTATCTVIGKQSYKCSVCGNVSDTKTYGPLGHDWEDWRTSIAPTCGADGKDTRACKRYGCGTVETRANTNRPAHKYEWVTTSQPTCVNTGKKVYKCSVCGNISQTVIIDKLDHDWEEWRILKDAVSCSEPGKKMRACKRYGCGTVEQEDITISHKYSWITTVAATCVTNGKKVYKCSVCGNVAKTEEIIAPGHDYQYVITKHPDFYNKGEKVEKCARCGLTNGQPISIPMVEFQPQYDNNFNMSFNYYGEGVENDFLQTYETYNGRTVVSLKFTTNYDWSVTAPSYVNIHDKATGKAISSGKAGTYTIYIWMNQGRHFENMTSMPYLTFKIENAVYSYGLEQFMVYTKSCEDNLYYTKSLYDYISKVQKHVSNLKSYGGSDSTSAIDYLCGNKVTNGDIKLFKYDDIRYIAVSSILEDESKLRINYIVFIAAAIPTANQLNIRLKVEDAYGMKIVQNGSNAIIDAKHTISSTTLNISDTEYNSNVATINNTNAMLKFLAKLGISLSPGGFLIHFVEGKVVDFVFDSYADIVKEDLTNNGNTAKTFHSKVVIANGCQMTNSSHELEVTCYGLNLYQGTTFQFNIYDSTGSYLHFNRENTVSAYTPVPQTTTTKITTTTNKTTTTTTTTKAPVKTTTTTKAPIKTTTTTKAPIKTTTTTKAPIKTTTTTKAPVKTTTTTNAPVKTTTTTKAPVKTTTTTNAPEKTTTTNATYTTTKITSTTTKITTTTTELTSTTTTSGRDVVQKFKLGDSITATMYDDGSVYIAGEGDMYDNDTCPFDNPEDIKNVIIQDFDAEHDKSITSIGANLFNGAENLEEIVLPEKIRKIGKGAFEGAKGLKDFALTEAIEMIGDNAFNGCTGLETVTYTGSEKQWDSVFIGVNNEALTDKIQFNSEISNPVEVTISGDTNGDGVISKADGILLSRFIAGWDNVNIVVVCGDINGDGIVSKADGMILARYLAGWEGYEKYFE